MEERKKAKSPAKGGVGVTGGSNSTTQLPPAFRFIKNADFIYQCRKPLFTLGKDPSMFHEFSESTYTLQDVNHESDLLAFESITAVKEKVISEEDKLEHLLSRRKVAKALLGMSLNGKMVEYFVTAGGIDAVYRLIRESEDMEVLSTCSACILHITTLTRFIVCLLNSHLLANVISLIEQGNEEIRHHCARSLAQISSTSASDVSLSEQSFQTLVITSGLMMALQMLFNKCKRNDSLTFSLLSLCNISPSISEVSDTEVSVRLVIIATKRLDILSDYESALLLSEVLKNLSRLAQFNYLLCEEGILLVLLALIDQFINKLEIVASCTEAIVNFSMNVKNRRKLVASGLHSRLIPIFALESPSVSTNLLLMIGNLLRVVSSFSFCQFDIQ